MDQYHDLTVQHTWRDPRTLSQPVKPLYPSTPGFQRERLHKYSTLASAGNHYHRVAMPRARACPYEGCGQTFRDVDQFRDHLQTHIAEVRESAAPEAAQVTSPQKAAPQPKDEAGSSVDFDEYDFGEDAVARGRQSVRGVSPAPGTSKVPVKNAEVTSKAKPQALSAPSPSIVDVPGAVRRQSSDSNKITLEELEMKLTKADKERVMARVRAAKEEATPSPTSRAHSHNTSRSGSGHGTSADPESRGMQEGPGSGSVDQTGGWSSGSLRWSGSPEEGSGSSFSTSMRAGPAAPAPVEDHTERLDSIASSIAARLSSSSVSGREGSCGGSTSEAAGRSGTSPPHAVQQRSSQGGATGSSPLSISLSSPEESPEHGPSRPTAAVAMPQDSIRVARVPEKAHGSLASRRKGEESEDGWIGPRTSPRRDDALRGWTPESRGESMSPVRARSTTDGSPGSKKGSGGAGRVTRSLSPAHRESEAARRTAAPFSAEAARKAALHRIRQKKLADEQKERRDIVRSGLAPSSSPLPTGPRLSAPRESLVGTVRDSSPTPLRERNVSTTNRNSRAPSRPQPGPPGKQQKKRTSIVDQLIQREKANGRQWQKNKLAPDSVTVGGLVKHRMSPDTANLFIRAGSNLTDGLLESLESGDGEDVTGAADKGNVQVVARVSQPSPDSLPEKISVVSGEPLLPPSPAERSPQGTGTSDELIGFSERRDDDPKRQPKERAPPPPEIKTAWTPVSRGQSSPERSPGSYEEQLKLVMKHVQANREADQNSPLRLRYTNRIGRRGSTGSVGSAAEVKRHANGDAIAAEIMEKMEAMGCWGITPDSTAKVSDSFGKQVAMLTQRWMVMSAFRRCQWFRVERAFRIWYAEAVCMVRENGVRRNEERWKVSQKRKAWAGLRLAAARAREDRIRRDRIYWSGVVVEVLARRRRLGATWRYWRVKSSELATARSTRALCLLRMADVACKRSRRRALREAFDLWRRDVRELRRTATLFYLSAQRRDQKAAQRSFTAIRISALLNVIASLEARVSAEIATDQAGPDSAESEPLRPVSGEFVALPSQVPAASVDPRRLSTGSGISAISAISAVSSGLFVTPPPNSSHSMFGKHRPRTIATAGDDKTKREGSSGPSDTPRSIATTLELEGIAMSPAFTKDLESLIEEEVERRVIYTVEDIVSKDNDGGRTPDDSARRLREEVSDLLKGGAGRVSSVRKSSRAASRTPDPEPALGAGHPVVRTSMLRGAFYQWRCYVFNYQIWATNIVNFVESREKAGVAAAFSFWRTAMFKSIIKMRQSETAGRVRSVAALASHYHHWSHRTERARSWRLRYAKTAERCKRFALLYRFNAWAALPGVSFVESTLDSSTGSLARLNLTITADRSPSITSSNLEEGPSPRLNRPLPRRDSWNKAEARLREVQQEIYKKLRGEDGSASRESIQARVRSSTDPGSHVSSKKEDVDTFKIPDIVLQQKEEPTSAAVQSSLGTTSNGKAVGGDKVVPSTPRTSDDSITNTQRQERVLSMPGTPPEDPPPLEDPDTSSDEGGDDVQDPVLGGAAPEIVQDGGDGSSDSVWSLGDHEADGKGGPGRDKPAESEAPSVAEVAPESPDWKSALAEASKYQREMEELIKASLTERTYSRGSVGSAGGMDDHRTADMQDGWKVAEESRQAHEEIKSGVAQLNEGLALTDSARKQRPRREQKVSDRPAHAPVSRTRSPSPSLDRGRASPTVEIRGRPPPSPHHPATRGRKSSRESLTRRPGASRRNSESPSRGEPVRPSKPLPTPPSGSGRSSPQPPHSGTVGSGNNDLPELILSSEPAEDPPPVTAYSTGTTPDTARQRSVTIPFGSSKQANTPKERAEIRARNQEFMKSLLESQTPPPPPPGWSTAGSQDITEMGDEDPFSPPPPPPPQDWSEDGEDGPLWTQEAW